jgi:hypothetical protein
MDIINDLITRSVALRERIVEVENQVGVDPAIGIARAEAKFRALEKKVRENG